MRYNIIEGSRCALPPQRVACARLPLTRPSTRRGRSRTAGRVCAGLGDWVKNFLDFGDGNWSPKSARIWRQQQYEYPGSAEPEEASSSGAQGQPGQAGPEAAPNVDRALEELQARLNNMPASARPALPDGDEAPGTSAGSGAAGPRAGQEEEDGDRGSGYDMRRLGSGGGGGGSFSDADDSELSDALNRRIGQIAASTASYDSSVTEEEMRQPMTAAELRELIFTKYGKTYDVSFVRRDIPGKTFVCMNIMWSHLEQRSFKLTEEQYMDKLDGVAYLVGALGQTDKVRAFLREPARSQKGLPPRPVVGTAISIRFDLEQSVIDEWFGNGYQ